MIVQISLDWLYIIRPNYTVILSTTDTKHCKDAFTLFYRMDCVMCQDSIFCYEFQITIKLQVVQPCVMKSHFRMKHSLILKPVANDAADCILPPSRRGSYVLSCSWYRSFLITVLYSATPSCPYYIHICGRLGSHSCTWNGFWGSFFVGQDTTVEENFKINQLLFLNFLFSPPKMNLLRSCSIPSCYL
jgi:hypothetical protein